MGTLARVPSLTLTPLIENVIYAYSTPSSFGGIYVILIDPRDGYAYCPCQGFLVRGICSHTLAAIKKVETVESTDVIDRLIKQIGVNAYKKGDWKEQDDNYEEEQ